MGKSPTGSDGCCILFWFHYYLWICSPCYSVLVFPFFCEYWWINHLSLYHFIVAYSCSGQGTPTILGFHPLLMLVAMNACFLTLSCINLDPWGLWNFGLTGYSGFVANDYGTREFKFKLFLSSTILVNINRWSVAIIRASLTNTYYRQTL